MLTSTSMRWLVVVAGAAMLLAFAAACAGETVEVPGETVVVKEEVIKEVQVPGETVVVEKEVIKEVMVPGETVTKEVIKEVEVPGETVVVEKEVVKTVEVPGQTVVVEKVVVKEVVKTVAGPEKIVVREVPGGKNYVTDPSTGKAVEAPRYGGTLTRPLKEEGPNPDIMFSLWVSGFISGVLQKPSMVNWGIDRAEFDFVGQDPPLFALKGALAESWSQPDPLTVILNIRKGVHWHDKPPMNGRELTAHDIEYNFHRVTGMGSGFTEPSAYTRVLASVSFESITATDKWTVVFKLKEPHLGALLAILDDNAAPIYPPEVIKEHGDATDWRNLVGTGPFMLTDYVEGSSATFIKNPDYWGFDEKYPQNRLPYVDQLRTPIMPEEATYLAALRSGKIDTIQNTVGIKSVDQAESLKRTNPEIVLWVNAIYSAGATGLNVNKPPFNDIRVRKAMQMALDLEAINNVFFKGYGDTTPHGLIGNAGIGYFIPFEEWPAELKKVFDYDPAGAEALLDEAGYPRGADGIRFKTVYTHLGRYDPSYTELLGAYWRDIGVDVEVQVTPLAQFSAIRKDRTFEVISHEAAYGTAANPLVGLRFLSSGPYNSAAVEDPVYDAMYEAAGAATTIEELQRLVKEADMYPIERHWWVWGPMNPVFDAIQPWVKGYNGEFRLRAVTQNFWAARLWIDQEMKEAMGH